MSQTIFEPSIELTSMTVPADWQKFLKLLNSCQHAPLVVDLSAVTYCDSAGLAFFIEAKKKAKQEQKQVEFASFNDNILALAKFYSVDKIITNS